MIERCGERQRKFNGLEKWPFRLFIEGLPIMLQVALFLLTCGLSRYMWSVNASVARVVISFTLFGFLFYIGIVIAGTSSYECPFQTPISITLRHLNDNEMMHMPLSSLSPLNIAPLIRSIRKKTRELVLTLSPPNTTSFIYASWVDFHQGLVSASRRAYSIIRHPSTWEFSLSQILSGIHNAARNIGHRAIILLLKMDRKFGNAKQRMAQGVRRFMRVGLLPTSTQDGDHQPVTPRNGQRLRVHVWNLETTRRQNGDNARCVSWVLRSITDPEAIDSAIRLAGAIRWFDGDADHDPPFDMIVSTFEACFDSTKQLYPGMRDRAYFSARAIIQINMRARIRLREHASKYPIPILTIPSDSFMNVDHDLHQVVWTLGHNVHAFTPTLPFPRNENTRTHSLWVSNLLVDLTRAGPNPILEGYYFYLLVANTNDRPTIANILVMWYMLLGGYVEEETFWAVDKSYAVDSLFLLPEYLALRTSDSLETILSSLSQRVMDVIADGSRFKVLKYLMTFLAAWKERPALFIPMAYQWCSAISEVAGKLGPDRMHTIRQNWSRDFSRQFGHEFPQVVSNCDPSLLINSPHIRDHPQDPASEMYLDFLTPLRAAFGLVGPASNNLYQVELNHTSHHDRVFETAFSSDVDDIIANAACAWIVCNPRPASSCARYFVKRAENTRPFSPRLRQVAMRVIENIWREELTASGLEVVCLLNSLEARVSDLGDEDEWYTLLVQVIRSPAGKNLISHYWRLLGVLEPFWIFPLDLPHEAKYMIGGFKIRDVEVMKSLEEGEDWEKLEIWIVVLLHTEPTPEWMENIGDATFKLISSRPSALQMFENLRVSPERVRVKLREVCERARAGRPLLESQQPPYVPIHPSLFFSVLTSSGFLFSQLVLTQPPVPFLFAGDDTFGEH